MVGTRRPSPRWVRSGVPLTIPTVFRELVNACVAGFRFCWLAGTSGTGPAGPTVPHSAFQTPWFQRPAHLLGIGDSVTAGTGATPGHSYFERLAMNPGDELEDMRGSCLSAVIPNLTVQNWAVPGSDSIQHGEGQIPRLTPAGPDVMGIVVMTTGGNDIVHDYGHSPPRDGAVYGCTIAQAAPWIASFERRLDGMLTSVRASFPGGCHIFLCNIQDPTDGTGSILGAVLPMWPDALPVLNAYNVIISCCAQKHPNVHVVDLHSLFLGHGLRCRQFWLASYHPLDPHYWYSMMADPNDRGYDAIRRLMLNEMAKVLAPSDN